MKTFLGILAGALLGFFGGIAYTGVVAASDKDVREYLEKKALDV